MVFFVVSFSMLYTRIMTTNRRLLRSITLQSLYTLELNDFKLDNLKDVLGYNARVFAEVPNLDVDELLESIESLLKKRAIIDEIIEKAAPEWPLEKIALIDKNILRFGIYELLFVERDKVPAKVALNEAIELAKEFGGQKSPRFVNGVLGAVYRELGEPGKDESTKKKFDTPYEEMPIDQKGAAVVYSIDATGVIRIGMVHDVFGYWTLSKGSIDPRLSPEEGTQKKIKEETNWDIAVEKELGESEYIAYDPERGSVRKQVKYYLGRSEYTEPQLEENPGGLDDVRWFDLSEITDLTMYDDVSQMLTKAIEIILEHNTAT